MRKITLLGMTIIWIALGTACNAINSQLPAVQTVPYSWIDTPLDGTAYPPNPCAAQTGCEVISHSSDPLHIVQVELSVNGQIVQNTPNADTSQTLVLTKQQWSPPGPGNYTLMVRAQNSAGVWGEYAQAIVTIGSTGTQPTPVAPPPFVVPSATPVTQPGVIPATPLRVATTTIAPTRTPTPRPLLPTPTFTFTPRPVLPTATFTSTPRPIPPTSTFTPTPSDRSGPSVNRVAPSVSVFYDKSGCGPTSFNVTANITDPSGVTNVHLWYRSASARVFTNMPMSTIGGNDYRATVNASNVSGLGAVQFYVTAQDGVGNSSQSATGSVSLSACVR
jgi:hypothetical protein